MDQYRRDKLIAADRNGGMTLEQLKVKYGLSLSQLSRITADWGATRVSHHPLNTADWLTDKLGAGMTVRMMAAEAKVPIATMRYWIAKHRGTTKRSSQAIHTVASVVGDWDNAEWFSKQYAIMGIPSIARLLGRSVGFVSGRLKRYGIERRTLKEAMSSFHKRPSQEWLQEHYVLKSWSITKCAEEFGCSFDTLLAALRDCGLAERSASEQHVGELNEFFGKRHTPEIRNYCASVGGRAGTEYWTTGDVEAKRELCSYLSKQCWSDLDRRRLASERIAKLCQEGKCNSKSVSFHCKSGQVILLRSSWEEAVAKFLDSCPMVVGWYYEDLLIPYMDGDEVRNYVVDFRVCWSDGLESLIEVKNPHLYSLDKEQLKLAALESYAVAKGLSYQVLHEKQQIEKILTGYVDRVQWNAGLFRVRRDYLADAELNIEAMVHSIIARVCPWPGVSYGDDSLQQDLERLRTEKLSSYVVGGLRSTAPNSGGMPGRRILTHFQPHFWDVAIRNSKPLRMAFDNKHVIYKSIRQSIKERESLSFERLLREINFHFTGYGRASHFAPGFARSIIKYVGASGGRVFDPCCGWGGRLVGAFFEGCQYSGCELSPQTCNGLKSIASFLHFDVKIDNASCLDIEWPDCDFVFTSPPFFDTEKYIGGDQPWAKYGSRDEWIAGFVRPFVDRIGNKLAALYLDKATLDEFNSVRPFSEVVVVSNRRHARRKADSEFLGIYR